MTDEMAIVLCQDAQIATPFDTWWSATKTSSTALLSC